MLFLPSSRGAVRAIALFEAAKGALVLFAGFGLLTLLHRDVGAVVGELIDDLHLNPSRKYPGIIIDAASRVTDERLWTLAFFALVYAAFRVFEGYGLWKQRAWAEWLALVSGALYLPIEIYSLTKKFTWIRISTFVANVAIVVFMGCLLWRSRKSRGARRLSKAVTDRNDPGP